MPPLPRVNVYSMAPHTALGLSRFLFDQLVPVAVQGPRMSFPDEPFADILALAGYDPDRTSEFVMVLDRDVDAPAAYLPDQCALHTLTVFEPVAVPVFCHLVPFGCVKTGEPYFLPRHANPVPVSDIGFPGQRARAALPAGAASLARALPERSPEKNVQPRRYDEENGHRFHFSRYSARLRFVCNRYSKQA